jgi:hypothetical protein
MNKKKDIYSVPVPEWALGYIFNGERDTITLEEEADIDEFMADIETINPPNNAPYFDAFPPFGLPCNVADCQVIYKEVTQ